MTLYRRLWRGFWSAVAALGVGLAALEWTPLALLTTLVLLVALSWLLKAMVLVMRGSGRTSSVPRPTMPHSFTVAVGIVTVWSFSRVSPPMGLLVVLMAVLSSPFVVARMVRPRRRPAQEPADTVEGEVLTDLEATGPLQGLDDLQLCRLWRESFWVLRRPAPPGTVLRLVALREACLDELERRDSVALHAWLDGGARASGGPEKYLARPRRRGPAAA